MKTKNNNQMSKKDKQKRREKLITIAFIGVLVIVLALALIQHLTEDKAPQTVQVVITEDGHVHTTDGVHVGTVEEMFGENGIVVTEEGHVHAADGTHLGDVDVPAADGEAK